MPVHSKSRKLMVWGAIATALAATSATSWAASETTTGTPGLASAPTAVWIDDSRILHVEAQPGQANVIFLGQSNGTFDLADRIGIAVSLPCRPAGGRVECPLMAFDRVVVDSGDGDDVVGSELQLSGFTISTGTGDDFVSLDSGGHDRVDLGPGNDRIQAGIGPGDTIIGGSGSDIADYSHHTLSPVSVRLDSEPNDGAPGEGDNIRSDVEAIVGTEGNDTLFGNNANNTLIGLAGNDTINGSGGNDLIIEGLATPGCVLCVPPVPMAAGRSGRDTISGGSGNDTVSYSARKAAVAIRLDGQPNDGETGEADNIKPDVENALGGAGNDTLNGTTGNNILRGLGGNDTLQGFSGNDHLEPGPGHDVISGGAGNDTATYIDHTTPVAVSLDNKANDGAPSEADNIKTDIENLNGTNRDDTLLGSAVANTLRGGAGNDRLFGRPGNDTLVGDSGHDQGFGDQGHDTCTTERRTSCP